MRRITGVLNRRFRDPKIARRYFITYCLGCCLGLAGIWFRQAPPGFPLGCPSDFTSFYRAAHIIRAGEGANLFDLETQARFQDPWLRAHGQGSIVPGGTVVKTRLGNVPEKSQIERI